MSENVSGGSEVSELRFDVKVDGASAAKKELNEVAQAANNASKAAQNGGANSASASYGAWTEKLNQLVSALKSQDSSLNKSTKSINTQSNATKKAASAYNALAKSIAGTSQAAAKMAKGNFGIAKLNAQTEEGRKKLKDWQAQMGRVGTPIVGQPKNLDSYLRNTKSLKKSLDDTTRAGIATKGTLSSLETGISTPFARGFTASEKFRLAIFQQKKDIESLFYTMQKGAQNMQWIGRQMIAGISLPIAALGTQSLHTFMDVEREFFQLQKVTEFKDMKPDGKISDFYKGLRADIRGLSTDFGIVEERMTGLFRDIAALGIDDPTAIKQWAEGISQISVLGDIDLSSATEFFRTTSAIFAQGNLQKTNEIMAQLNAIADETSLQLGDLAQAFPEVAPVMKQLGFDAAGVASSLAAMYKRGIPATEAAHALKFGFGSIIAPTKKAGEIIDQLGISFFDANGQFTDADKNLISLVAAMKGLAPESGLQSAAEIFGKRQSARMQSYFDDVALGIKELQQYQEDGKITAEEYGQAQSDWLRGMMASGKLGQIEGVDSAEERYKNALDMYRKNPAFMWDQLKTQLKQILTDIGALITPAVLEWGKKLTGFLQKIMSLPSGTQKFIVAIAAMAAAMGPLVYITAQAGLAISTFGKVATRILPSGIKNITKLRANELLDANPNRKDIMQVGDRVVQKRGGLFSKFKKTGDDGELIRAKFELGEVAVASEVAKKAADDFGDEMIQTALKTQVFSKSGGDAKARLGKLAADMEYFAQQRASAMSTFSGVIPKDKLNELDNNLSREFLLTLDTDQVKKDVDKVIDEGRRIDKSADVWGRKSGRKIGNGIADEGKKGINKLKSIFANVIPNIGGRAKNSKVGLFGTKLATDFKKAKGEGTGLTSVLKGLFSSGGKGAASLLSSVLGLALGFGQFLAVAAAVAAPLFLLIYVFKDIGKYMNYIKAIIINSGAWDQLKQAIGALKGSLEIAKKAFLDIFNSLGFGNSEMDESKTKFGILGTAISGVIKFIAMMVKAIALLIRFAMPAIKIFATMFRDVVGFIISLANGDWKSAMFYFLDFLWQMVRPAAMILEVLVDVFLWAIQKIAQITIIGAQLVVKSMMIIPKVIGGIVNAIGGIFGKKNLVNTDAVDSWMDSYYDKVTGFWGKIRDFSIVGWVDEGIKNNLKPLVEAGFGGAVADGVKEGEDEAADAGGNLGDTLGDKILDNTKDKLKNADIFGDFLGTVKSKLEEQISDLKDSAKKALEKSQDAGIKMFEDRIKAIEDQEKAEEELYRTQEYLEKKKELLYNRSINVQNYNRERALAIYEGRIDDARMLDLQQQKDTHDFNKDLGDLELDRQKDLVKAAREAEKDKINAAKEAQQKIYDDQKEAFEKQLDLITQYTPRTVAEYDAMMQKISGLLNQYGVNVWPEIGKSGAQRFGEALRDANEQIRQDFAWSGKAAVTAWMASFIDADVWEILKSKTEDAGDAMSDMADDADTAFDDMNEDAGGFGDTLADIAQSLKDLWNNSKTDESDDPFKDWNESAGNLGENISSIIRLFGFFIEEAISGIANAYLSFESFAAGILNMSWIWGFISGIASLAWDTIKNNWADAPIFFGISFNQIMNIASTVWNGIARLAGWSFGVIFDHLGDLPIFFGLSFNNIMRIASSVWQGITGVASWAWNSIWNIISITIGNVTRIFWTIYDTATKIWHWLFNINWSGAWRNIKDTFVTIINGIIQIWNRLSFTLPSFTGDYILYDRFGLHGGQRIDTLDIPYFSYHTGGIAGLPALSNNEVLAVLEKGEGILPTSAMTNIGLHNFDLLRRGFSPQKYQVPEIQGGGPRVVNNTNSNTATTNIYVDTFIGEEEWFAKLAEKYDMDVNVRKAKSSGSQQRVISRYNTNERGTYK